MKRKPDFKNGIFHGKPIYVLAVILLTVLLVISILTAVTIGSVDLSVKDVYSVILYKVFGIGDPEVYGVGAMSDIVWFIRLPRILLATAVGMGLAVAGVVMQAIVKNPIADPYILGISSGASLGATVAIFLGVGAVFGSNSIGICAFIGAFLISVLVQITANIGGRANSVRLLLAGTALGSVCSAFSNFVVYIAGDRDGIQTVTFWLMGSLAGAKWENLAVIIPCIIRHPQHYTENEGESAMTIAILAHDSRKELALQFCTAYSGILSRNTVIATGTTGRMLAQATGLPVHCYLSGKLGGIQQISSRVACDEVDLVLFFRDPLKADTGNSCEQNLLRLCDMHSVPIATNIATAEVLLRGLDQGDLDYRDGMHPEILEPISVHCAVC